MYLLVTGRQIYFTSPAMVSSCRLFLETGSIKSDAVQLRCLGGKSPTAFAIAHCKSPGWHLAVTL